MDKREEEYKERIRANLNNVLASGFVPELGEHRKGKRSDVHISGDKIIIVASDRVSCFDHILSRCIPFKGAILNLFNVYGMDSSADIVPNAMLPSPDVNVVIQRNLKNSGFECVPRGYVWGSLADAYEAGKREKSGIKFEEGLHRYQKISTAFTPTTKAEAGHDVDVTLEDIAKAYGEDGVKVARALRDKSIAMFIRAQERARRAGMLFIDTKYEFFFDDKGNLYVGDEVNTPDSSRLVDTAEYHAKFTKIVQEMSSGKYKNVSELLRAKPELKITEASKQYVRDVLIEAGYKDGKPLPELTDEQVVETAWRYIDTYERLTGRKFDFVQSELLPKKRIMNNLRKAGLAYGGCVIPMGASESDIEHWKNLESGLKDAKVPYRQPFFKSAHKGTREVLDYIAEMDTSIEPIVYLSFAGRSNGHGPVVAGNTNNPVIACPVFKDVATYAVDIHSSLRMPSKLPLATIVDPGNAALYAKRIINLAR